MARSRRSGGRSEANIWPGFVDAMTALLLVIMFVLSIFMIIQFVLRETITGQESELGNLSAQVASLAQALGLEQTRGNDLSNQLGQLDSQLDDARDDLQRQSAMIASLSNAREAAQVQIASFEEQVASLISQNTVLNGRNSTLQNALQSSAQLAENQANRLKEQENAIDEQEAALGLTRAQLAELEIAREQELTQKEAAQLALARARSEISSETELARLAAAKADALQTLIESLEADAASSDTRNAALEAEAAALKAAAQNAQTEIAALTEAEKNRLLEAAAAEALRAKLLTADTELTAMTLALEEQRQKAEDTLTLLAAAELAQERLGNSETDNLNAITEKEALLARANDLLSQEKALSAESQRQVALLNQQTAALRKQLNSLQGLLDASAEADREARVQLQTLGSDLNAALARVAAEQKARADLEAKENIRLAAEAAALEAEAVDLRSFRSDFFGRISQVLAEQDGIQVVGDRFVFSSEVLFAPGSADLGFAGRQQISAVAEIIRTIQSEIPSDINWVLRVDGHTDNTRLGSTSEFADNWELSQARALSVVKYLIDSENIPANRLAATGFGEFQPVNNGTSSEALAENRRIELKLTEK